VTTAASAATGDRETVPSIGRRWWTPLAASIVTGIAVFAAMPPFDLGWVAFVALVPLLWVWRDAGAGRAARYGFVAGVVYFSLLLSWVFFFGPFAVVPFVAVLAAQWALIGALVAWLARLRLRSPWLTAAVWVTVEASMGRQPLGGFSWGEVGYAFHGIGLVRTLASWGGVLLVSYAVVATNAFLLEALLAYRARSAPTARRDLGRSLAGLLALVVLTSAAWLARFEPRPTGELSFALLQANDLNRDLTAQELNARYLPRNHLLLADRLEGDYDLIVFPESSLDEDPRLDPNVPGDDLGALDDELTDLARAHDAWVLANASVEVDHDELENTDFLYRPDGELEGTYVKRHVVPFGEYVPGRDYLDFIGALDQVPRDFRGGDELGIFDVAGHTIGNVICFESAFGPEYRDTVRAGAELMVVQTNNRSYRRSQNSEQHVALSQMRAVETGRPVLHSAISGITAVIDADGDILETTGLFDVAAVEGSVTTTTGDTPYVRFGDWVPALTLIVTLGAFGFGFVRARRRS